MEPGTREQGATRELGEVAGDDDEQPVDAGVAELVEIGPARFVVDKLRRQQVHSVLRIVRWLDRSLNNTSLILLLTVGERRLLFGGDAQIENWSYAIGDGGHPDRARYLEALRKVDLYKVGHHGSRNATPKTLYRGWRKASGHGTAPLSLMSTLSRVYGESDGTFVPSALLTSALGRSPFRLVSTEAYARDLLYVDVAAGVDLGDTFQVKPGAG